MGRRILSCGVNSTSKIKLTLVVAVLLALQAALFANAAPDVESLSAAGATFPYPVYAKWATKYNQNTGLKIGYQAIGSGGGIVQIKAKTVDFGASDEPLKAEELNQHGLVQFPMIMGGVVPVIHVEGIAKGKLKLTPELLADIYLAKIKKWNDPRIMAVNPDLRLPDKEITVVHRADGSGTTWIFTNYLSKVSPDWKEKVGNDKSVSWPTGVGGKGNEGVSVLVKKTDGAIGYVEYAYALRERLKFVQLQNRAGKFVAPTIETFQAAAANADWDKAPGFYMVLTDQPGEKSWPIVGASYILIYKDQLAPAKAGAMLKFFDWCFKQGQSMATDLHYVPIPLNVYNLVESDWTKQVTAAGAPAWK
ncbi:MAG: phosphate ABC transporter substrate-binding protein PstS [Desulfomonilaceae bacterium]